MHTFIIRDLSVGIVYRCRILMNTAEASKVKSRIYVDFPRGHLLLTSICIYTVCAGNNCQSAGSIYEPYHIQHTLSESLCSSRFLVEYTLENCLTEGVSFSWYA